jgi:hypothetical protein
MAKIKILPFDKNICFPQRQKVQLGGNVYDLFYRWNHKSNFGVLKISKAVSGEIVSVMKLVKFNPSEIRDPTTLELLFTIFPYEITNKNAEIWVFI